MSLRNSDTFSEDAVLKVEEDELETVQVVRRRQFVSGSSGQPDKESFWNSMVPKAHLVELTPENETSCIPKSNKGYEDSIMTQENQENKSIALSMPLTSFNQHEKSFESLTYPKNVDKTCAENFQQQSHANYSSILKSDKVFESKAENNCGSENDDKAAVLSLNSPLMKPKKSNNALLTEFPLSSSNGFNLAEQPESARAIGSQTLFPFLVAGLGMVAAGIVLDSVQANRGYFEDAKKKWSIIWGNMFVVEAQAMVIAFLASFVAMILGWIPDGKWETEHAIILCTGSLLTGAIASGVLGMIMILVIVWSTKLGINPDNVATPIAASLGDLITLSLLSGFVKLLFSVLYNPNTAWIGPAIIVIFILLTPLFLWLAYRNDFTRDVIRHGWVPVISAMSISSAGGFILDFAVSKNPGIAVFSPVINGVGGNLVAIQASRISTYLHTTGLPMGRLPEGVTSGCISPWKTFFDSSNLHAVGARVMLSMVVPGQLMFVLIIHSVQAGHTSITAQFVLVYLLVSLVQVAVLLQVCNWLVLRLWKNGSDPDNSAIPYLTALGDLLGTGLLSLGFLFLWFVGDRDMDVGD